MNSRLEQFQIDAKGSDRMNPRHMTAVISHTVAAAFRTFKPKDPEDHARILELADLLELGATCRQIMQSRVIEDKSDKFNCALR